MRKAFLIVLGWVLHCPCFCQQKYWQAVGSGITKYSFELHTDSNFLYTCGNGVSYWDGNSWNYLPNPPDNTSLLTITTADSSIYVGGYYNNVFRFNSGKWEQVGANFKTRPIIRDLHGFENSVFVRGMFDSIGSKPFEGIAEWNGTHWVEIRGGLKGVNDFENFNNELYAVGNLTWTGSTNQPVGWAKWTGSKWIEADTTVKLKTISGIKSYGTGLLLFGVYDTIDGIKMNGLVDYDGRNYTSIYDPNNRTPRNLTKLDTTIYGYRLYHPQINTWDYIGVRFKNGHWEDFGGVFNGYVIDLNHYRGELYFGGAFSNCNSINTGTVAVFKEPSEVATKRQPLNHSFLIYPNPTSNYFTISGTKEGQKAVIVDVFGKIVHELNVEDEKHSLASLNPGLYFVNIINTSGKIVFIAPLLKN